MSRVPDEGGPPDLSLSKRLLEKQTDLKSIEGIWEQFKRDGEEASLYAAQSEQYLQYVAPSLPVNLGFELHL